MLEKSRHFFSRGLTALGFGHRPKMCGSQADLRSILTREENIYCSQGKKQQENQQLVTRANKVTKLAKFAWLNKGLAITRLDRRVINSLSFL